MLVTWASLNDLHPNTAQCTNGVDWKRCRLAAEEMQASTEWYFRAYGCPFNSVSLFKYLGLVLISLGDDWNLVVAKLRKERTKWDRLLGILGQEGENMRVPGIFLNAVVQVVLLFSFEKWAMTLRMGLALGGFHNRVA